MVDKGYSVVLTCDRTLMSDYGGGVFLGFAASFPRGIIPDRVYFSLFCPSVRVDHEGRASFAPYGLRKIEASLIEHGFDEGEVIVAHPDQLDKVVGAQTRILALCEFDPLGVGPATSTFTQLFLGEAYMSSKFKEILDNQAVRRYRPRIVVGGPGAWQLQDERIRRQLGIDHIVLGEGELVVGDIFSRIIRGESCPPVIHGAAVPVDAIPTIKQPSVHGIVEIARGCGRGCDFCQPTLRTLRSLPINQILQEVDVNLRTGKQPLLHAEDVLRYMAKGLEVNKEAVINLFKSVREHPGVRSVSISHFSLASVAASPDLISELSAILRVGKGTRWISGQTGIETGSPRLIERHMRGKCKPFTPEAWPEVVVNSFQILSENNWVPCGTLIIGLPGETDQDVERTVQLVERLREFKSLIVPLFYVAMGASLGKSASFTIDRMTRLHGELFIKCWRHNIMWLPTLLDEYSKMTMSDTRRYALKFLVSRSARYADDLMDICEREYNFELYHMIQDIKSGKLSVTPLPLRITNKIRTIGHGIATKT